MAARSDSSVAGILEDLKNQIYSPVYLLQGDEPYFIDVISDYMEQHVLNEMEKEFNQTICYGRDTDVATIIAYARRFPMMANYQLLIVKEAQELDKPEELLTYLENPQPSTLLVLCYKYDKLDKRKSLYKAIERLGVTFDSDRLYDDRIPEWISDYLRRTGYTINPKAAILLTEFVGNDLSKVVNELEKLCINIPAGTQITEDYIEKNIGISKDYNVFELQRALGKKDVVKANRIIRYFAANPRENPLVKVLPILYSFFSKILIYHSLQDKSRNNVAAALSIKPFFVPDYQQAAGAFPPGKVVSVIALLREYDMRAKGVDNNAQFAGDGELMTELVFRMLH